MPRSPRCAATDENKRSRRARAVFFPPRADPRADQRYAGGHRQAIDVELGQAVELVGPRGHPVSPCRLLNFPLVVARAGQTCQAPPVRSCAPSVRARGAPGKTARRSIRCARSPVPSSPRRAALPSGQCGRAHHRQGHWPLGKTARRYGVGARQVSSQALRACQSVL